MGLLPGFVEDGLDVATLGGYGAVTGLGSAGDKTDTSALDEDAERSRRLYEQFLEERRRPGYQPTQVASTDVQARDVNLRDLPPVERVGSQAAAAPRDVRFDPGNLTVAGPGPAEQATAATVGPAGVDQAAAGRVVGRQDALLDAMQLAASGQAPSVAENQFRAQMQTIADEQLGAAARARGTGRGAALREASLAIGRQGAATAAQSAALRAGEMAQARGDLSGALTAARGADQALAVEDARLGLTARTGDADRITSTNVTNAGMRADNQRLGVVVAQENAARELERAKAAAAVAAGNRDASVAVDVRNADATNVANATNAAAQNQRSGQTMQTGAAVDAGNADRSAQVQTGNAQRQQGAQEANQGAGLTAAGQEIQRQQGLGNQALEASGQKTDVTKTKIGVAQADKQREVQASSAWLGGAAAGAEAAAKSDRRAKTDIRPIPARDTDEFIAALERASKAYEYTDPDEPGADEGDQYGVIAQELARSRIGRSVLVRGRDGMLGVQPERLTMALAGVVAKLARERRA